MTVPSDAFLDSYDDARECQECGHQHWEPLTHGYSRCPIPECPCPYAAGEPA